MICRIHVFAIVFSLSIVCTATQSDSWTGSWFPKKPSELSTNTIDVPQLSEGQIEAIAQDSWTEKWFPFDISKKSLLLQKNLINADYDCDNGKHNIAVDFDPDNRTHSYKYLCLDFRSKYKPSFATSPLQQETIIPPSFKAASVCLNETIEYDTRLPTFGAHRYLYPLYGEYTYLPPQRWMHSLKNGAIVMLYHPCANMMQVEELRKVLAGCLYRHIITPYQLLLPNRPLAVLAWGNSLQMSIVDVPAVVEFIKKHAKILDRTLEESNQKYNASLLTLSRLITDQFDKEVCGNINL